MSEKKINPIRPTDEEARRLARGLLRDARFASLGVIDPETGGPVVTRVGIGISGGGNPVTLVSSLSQHTGALRNNPDCSILVGEPGDRGDPLTHPRLTLNCRARQVERQSELHAEFRASWLETHPKAKLYIDFADFSFVLLKPQRGLLNGGFGKAFILTPEDMIPPGG